MFAVVYRLKVKKGHELDVVEAWDTWTLEVRELVPEFGSFISRNANNEFVALGIWPNESTWKNFLSKNLRILRSTQMLESCLTAPLGCGGFEVAWTNMQVLTASHPVLVPDENLKGVSRSARAHKLKKRKNKNDDLVIQYDVWAKAA